MGKKKQAANDFEHKKKDKKRKYSDDESESSSSKSEDFWFKSVHQVKMGNCKNITAIGAHNQVKFDPY